MRSRSLVLLLALAGTALSGCASGFDTAFTQSSIPGVPGGGNSTDTGGDGLSGDTGGTGDPNAVNLSGGDTAIAYADGARSIDGSGRAQMVISATGSTATVSVDPGANMGFTGTQTMARYIQQTNPAPAGHPTRAFDNANYTEYRRINTSTDSALQVWQFTDGNGQTNYAAHFRESRAGQDAWFYGGSGATSATEMDALAAGGGTRNYTGNYAGIATANDWGDATNYQTQDGEWRFNGTASLQANFGTGQFTGTLTPEYWEKYDNDVLIQLDIPNNTITSPTIVASPGVPTAAGPLDITTFHRATIELNGTITGNRISGDANINTATPGDLTNNRFVNGDRALQGGFYGTNAEQVTGVFATYGVLPEPTGGDTGINDERRPSIDIQGVFHGRQ